MTSRRRVGALLGTLLTLSATACAGEDPEETAGDASSSSEATSEQSMSEESMSGDASEESMSSPGAWIDWADYDADRAAYAASDVVLFFHADWCPDCRATGESLDSEGVPDGLTVVKVDFDEATELRREYGVTVQHTFVHVDDEGTALSTWTGSGSGADIAAEL